MLSIFEITNLMLWIKLTIFTLSKTDFFNDTARLQTRLYLEKKKKALLCRIYIWLLISFVIFFFLKTIGIIKQKEKHYKNMSYIGAIDQGTSSSRFLVISVFINLILLLILYFVSKFYVRMINYKKAFYWKISWKINTLNEYFIAF